ncbi:MAG: fibronectin type III domain-containing protein [Eubacterium sp.]
MKKFISLLLSAVMLLSVTAGVNLSACAETTYTYNSSTGSFNYIVLDNGTIEIERVIMNNGVALESIVIPSAINGKTVTSLGNSSLSSSMSGMRNAKNVSIPNTVKNIGESAFNSSGITSISIPSGVEGIGDNAFSNCDLLTSVTIPGSVKKIGNFSFSYCDNIESVTISNGVEVIGEHAFSGCEKLTKLSLGNGVKVIGLSAFSPSRLSSVIIPSSVTSIDSWAFTNYYLTTVKIYSKSCKIADWSVFYNSERISQGKKINLYGYRNSTTQTYVSNNSYNYKFYALDPTIKSATLSTTSYTYNGKVKTPSVKITDSNGRTLVKNTDYTVTYASGRKNVGKYSVKIKFKGNYTGTKTLYFTIKPKATSISSVSAGSKRFTVKWKKQSTQTTGYQIQYSTSSKFTSPKYVTVSSYKTTSKTVKSLKAKKKYYVRVRTYKTVSGTKYYSSWSKAKSVTTKK